MFFTVYVAVTALSLPGAAIMTLIAGALFGLLVGTAIVSFASSIGATLAFLSARFLLRDWVRQPTQFLAKRDGYLAELSAWIDKGRLYFPRFALDVIGPRTEPPPPAYRRLSAGMMLRSSPTIVPTAAKVANV